MDVDAVLQSVQERDKWRHRLELLTADLQKVREQRRRAVGRLRRIRSELKRLQAYSEALLDQARAPITQARMNAERSTYLPFR
jgi:phage shock protein A